MGGSGVGTREKLDKARARLSIVFEACRNVEFDAEDGSGDEDRGVDCPDSGTGVSMRPTAPLENYKVSPMSVGRRDSRRRCG